MTPRIHLWAAYTQANWCFLCTAMLRLRPISQVTGMSDTIDSKQSMLGGVAASLQRKLAGVSADFPQPLSAHDFEASSSRARWHLDRVHPLPLAVACLDREMSM